MEHIIRPPTLTQQPIPRGLLVAALLVVLLWGMSAAQAALIPLCISALLAFTMNPLVRLLRRIHVPEWIAITLSAILLILPLLGIIYLLVREAQSLVQDFPRITASWDQMIAGLSHRDFARHFDLLNKLSLTALTERISESAGHGLQLVLGGLTKFLEAGSQIVLILIFAVLMLASRNHLRKCGEEILAQFENIESATMLNEVSTLIEAFIMARMIVIVIMGVISTAILWAFGVRYSFLIGAFIGVLTLVPEIGFLISMVPVIGVALATGHSVVSLLALVGIIFAVHLLEANVLSPKLVGNKLNINALSTFIGLFVGGLMWGVWGMFLSVPLLGVMRIAFSAAPSLRPWADLLAEREDRRLTLRLSRWRRPSNELKIPHPS